MTDLLGEALAEREADYKRAGDGELIWDVSEEDALIFAAARNWHALTNPTDELIERLGKVMVDDGWTCDAHEPEPLCADCKRITEPTARHMVDALTVTAEPEAHQ